MWPAGVATGPRDSDSRYMPGLVPGMTFLEDVSSPAVQIRHRLEFLRLRRLQRPAAREYRRPFERNHEALRRHLVVIVDVVAEMHGAVAHRPAGEIDPGDRHRMREPDVGARAARDAGIDLAPAP